MEAVKGAAAAVPHCLQNLSPRETSAWQLLQLCKLEARAGGEADFACACAAMTSGDGSGGTSVGALCPADCGMTCATEMGDAAGWVSVL